MKFTKFEKEELVFKLEIIRDEEEMLQDLKKSEDDIDALIKRVKSDGNLEGWELKLLAEEAENLLDIAEANYSDGFPEYYPAVRKLRKLNAKLEAAND